MGQKLYWPSFSSASLDIEKAKWFANRNCGDSKDNVLFVIITGKNIPSHNIEIKDNWTYYS
jgi:hypothetical protein